MTSYIPKQVKPARERLELKLDHKIVGQLEKYCRYLESDRDYVISQALEIAFKKDKGFGVWLTTQGPLERGDQTVERERAGSGGMTRKSGD